MHATRITRRQALAVGMGVMFAQGRNGGTGAEG